MLSRMKPELLETILNSTDDAMVAIDREGHVILFNDAAERLINVKRDDAIGKFVKDVIPNTRLLEVVRTGQKELTQQQELGNTTIVTSRVPVRDGTGEIIGAVAVFRDISEVKKLADQVSSLLETRTLLEAIINATHDAISVVDEHGLGILINPAYTRITGLTADEVIAKPATTDIAEGESMHLKVLSTGQPVRGALMKVGPHRKKVMVNVAPIMVNEQLKGSVAVIHDVSEIQKLTEELEDVRRMMRRLDAKYTFADVIGSSPAITSAVDQAQRIARTNVTVLLRGESGTGKELFAHAIHNSSRRSNHKFVRVNCAALSESLLESELFGYVEGAFTGAKRGGKTGLFEEAHLGTIFLDEISELSFNLQSKLLRVLQEKEIIRVGDTKPITVDVRVVAATNASLEELMSQKKFREDLYYRLNMAPVFIPPLKHRKEDIPKLIDFFVRKYNMEFGRNISHWAEPVLEHLNAYDWPGNIRELENAIGRAIINMKVNETVLEAHHLPSLGSMRPSSLHPPLPVEAEAVKTYEEYYHDWEKQLLSQVMAKTGGNKTKAARLLNISIRSLYYKLEKYNLG